MNGLTESATRRINALCAGECLIGGEATLELLILAKSYVGRCASIPAQELSARITEHLAKLQRQREANDGDL